MRVSTEDQARERFSLLEQKERLEPFCEFKGFWNSIMSHFHKRICYDKDNNYKIVRD